jgi:multidrug efflux pump subunit AcrA (membrane-fusion protein)
VSEPGGSSFRDAQLDEIASGWTGTGSDRVPTFGRTVIERELAEALLSAREDWRAQRAEIERLGLTAQNRETKIAKLARLAVAEQKRSEGAEAELQTARAEIERLTAERDAARATAAGGVLEAHRAAAEIEAPKAELLAARMDREDWRQTAIRESEFGNTARHERDVAQARLAAVGAQLRQLHYVHPVGGDCGECGEPMPCDTLVIFDRAAATGTDPEGDPGQPPA